MPHIVPLSEKRRLCRWPTQTTTPHIMRVPDKFLDRAMEISHLTWPAATSSDKTTIFKLIEDILAETLPTQINSKYFNEFVNIKEVPTWET